ncbi:MAG: hypothetical protein NT175_03215 [Bacteroidetes bacterium]|nr:hypothetical protein [Bacteroidota bacterium]
MKKQFLFILILALLAGTSQVFAQAVGGSPPQPINCAGTAANPIAGVPYDYSALINPALGSAYWYATNSTTFMTAGARPAGIELLAGGTVVEAATNYMDLTIGDASPTTTNITWTSDGLAANTPPTATDPPTLFVALEYDAPAAGCANNVKVYPIRPINAFVVDIMNMTPGGTQTPSGYGVVETQCFAGVQSAVWQAAPAPDGSIVYDFGTNVLYYEVIAANFTELYTPQFQISGLQGNQTADLDWGYTIGTYDHNVTTGSGNGIYASPDVLTDLTNTSTGVSIYVRLTMHNANWEGLAQLPVELAVDAVNSALQDDVNNATCLVNTPFEDNADQTVDPRPTVTGVAPNTFLPVAP